MAPKLGRRRAIKMDDSATLWDRLASEFLESRRWIAFTAAAMFLSDVRVEGLNN